MAIKVTMPKLGLTMTEGTIREWRKREGEQVTKGEILYVLETEKVTYEVEATESGILGKIVAPDSVIPVGGVVAYILQPGEKLADIPELAGVDTIQEIKPAETPKPVIERSGTTQGIKISPLARRIAEEHNIDIGTIKGTGPEGRIVKEDALRAVEEKRTAAERPPGKEPVEGQIVPLTSMRKTIARRMAESFQTAPHFWVTSEADATDLKRLHQQLLPLIEKETGVRLTYTDLLAKVVAKTLKEYPNVNASWTPEGIKILSEINIGIATDVPGGLIVPVIRYADKKSLAELAAVRADLVTRGREGKLSLHDITGSTFTLNNVGALGIKCINAIINPPESAILTVGSAIDRPVVIKGEIVIRPIMELSLALDHRVLDGASGGRFLQRVRELIESPALLLL